MSKYYMGPSPLLVTAQHRRLACFLRPQSALGGGGRNRERDSPVRCPKVPTPTPRTCPFRSVLETLIDHAFSSRPLLIISPPPPPLHLSYSLFSALLILSAARPSIGVFCIVHSLSELQVTGL
ncbi:hypothetical protein DTO282F9_5005 [Paecilomyces variotii]|nr:hypothetical protein DTO282F9_5005 [Paecilomyces variotii]